MRTTLKEKRKEFDLRQELRSLRAAIERLRWEKSQLDSGDFLVGGVPITPPTIPPSPGILATVTAIGTDSLTCTANGSSETVAKPFLLQRTPFHDNSITFQDGQNVGYSYSNPYTRVATDSPDSETQVITPGWFIGDILLVFYTLTNISNVYWQDCNMAGRQWGRI